MYLTFPRYILVRHNFPQSLKGKSNGGYTVRLIRSRGDIVSTIYEASLVYSTHCNVTEIKNLLSSARDWRTQERPTPGSRLGSLAGPGR